MGRRKKSSILKAIKTGLKIGKKLGKAFNKTTDRRGIESLYKKRKR